MADTPGQKAPSLDGRFDIKRDIAIEKAGGVFCQACLTGRTDLSPDPRYCQRCYDLISGEPKLVNSTDHWSDCGQAHFCGGKGYGISSTLKTVCIGNEAEVLEAFVTGKIPEGFNETQKQVLRDILTYRKEKAHEDRTDRAIPTKQRGYQPGARKIGNQRSGLMLDTRHKPAGIRRSQGHKRLPMRLPKSE